MRVLVTSLREKSHFLPLVAFIEALGRRGHTVAVSAPADLEERVRPLGVEFLPFGHPGDEGLRPIWARMRGLTGDAQTEFVMTEIFAGACASAALPRLLDHVEAWRPDVVLRESCEFAGLVAAEKVGVPHARVAIFGQQWERKIHGLTTGVLDAHGAAIGLDADPAGARARAEPAFTLFPRGFEEVEPLGPLHRCRLPRRDAAPPLPDWWGGREAPFVYVTLGMVTGGFGELRAAYATACEALAASPVRALLTIGAALPPEAIGAVPPHVHVERFVPQDDVLPHAAAVICHGGSGTVLGALSAGKPMIVTPLFADQPYNAARVAATGAGLALPTGLPSAGALRDALDRVLGDPAFTAAAQGLAREIASRPTTDVVTEQLERLAR